MARWGAVSRNNPRDAIRAEPNKGQIGGHGEGAPVVPHLYKTLVLGVADGDRIRRQPHVIAKSSNRTGVRELPVCASQQPLPFKEIHLLLLSSNRRRDKQESGNESEEPDDCH